jgi:phosphate starvation-inducible PhoH-like protein
MSEGRLRSAPGRQIDLGEAESQALFGIHDANLRVLEEALGVQISARDHEVFLEGDEAEVELAARVIGALGRVAARGIPVGKTEITTAARLAAESPSVSLERFFTDSQLQTAKGRFVRPKGPNQKLYMEAIRSHDIVFAVGPAGTGKTFLAMALAIEALNARRVRRIVLARPAIEAGEKLGFLPGDMFEKVNPYLRPLYDALYALVDFNRAERLLEKGQIEIAPLAFMRGRTLSESFVILDEAQNTTPDQMKMFLTRLGVNSKAVVNGDITQIDLKPGQDSGLIQAKNVLAGVEGIAHVVFDERDVVRHELVKLIVAAYDRYDRSSSPDRSRAPAEGEPDG